MANDPKNEKGASDPRQDWRGRLGLVNEKKEPPKSEEPAAEGGRAAPGGLPKLAGEFKPRPRPRHESGQTGTAPSARPAEAGEQPPAQPPREQQSREQKPDSARPPEPPPAAGRRPTPDAPDPGAAPPAGQVKAPPPRREASHPGSGATDRSAADREQGAPSRDQRPREAPPAPQHPAGRPAQPAGPSSRGQGEGQGYRTPQDRSRPDPLFAAPPRDNAQRPSAPPTGQEGPQRPENPQRPESPRGPAQGRQATGEGRGDIDTPGRGAPERPVPSSGYPAQPRQPREPADREGAADHGDYRPRDTSFRYGEAPPVAPTPAGGGDPARRSPRTDTDQQGRRAQRGGDRSAMGAGAYGDYAASRPNPRHETGQARRPPTEPPADRAASDERYAPRAPEPDRDPYRRQAEIEAGGDANEAALYDDRDEAYRGAHARELAYVEEGYGDPLDPRRTHPSLQHGGPGDYDDGYDDYEEDAAAPQNPRRRAPLILLGALLGVAVLAGGIVYLVTSLIGGGSDDAPPVIAAPSEPSKLEPQDQLTEPAVPRQTKLIYDRILSEDDMQEERLVPRAEEPLSPGDREPAAAGEAPEASGTDAQQPQPAGDEGALPAPQPPPTPGGGDQSGLPTFQDGQQIAGIGSDVTPNPAGAEEVPPMPGEIAGAPVTRASPAPPPAAPEQVAATTPEGTESETGTPETASNLSDPPPTPKPKPPASARSTSQDSGSPLQLAPTPAETGAASAQQEPEAVRPNPGQAGRQSNISGSTGGFVEEPGIQNRPNQTLRGAGQPVQQQQQQAAAVPEPPPAPDVPRSSTPSPASTTSAASGAYVIQMASYREEQDARAEFNRLQQSYPDLLGGYNPMIEQADLGARGTFYRLRIGPVASRDTASRLCTSLIASGEKDCLVRGQ